MPTQWAAYRISTRCRRAITWAVRRGHCRFDQNHAGPCKPNSGRA